MSVARLNAVDEGLPRSVSVLRSHPNYDHRAESLSSRISVYIDGLELPEVAVWDVDAGWVIRNRRYKNGAPALDGDGLPILETLRGTVEVRWSRGSAA